MSPKEVRYTVILGQDCRRRHFHRSVSKWVVEFTVQLEVFFKNQWYPIIRYDTAHGFAHRDLIHFNGRVEKTDLNIKDISDSLTFAENDIKVNWNIYRNNFLKEACNE